MVLVWFSYSLYIESISGYCCDTICPLTVCTCTPCQRASYTSKTDSFLWGHGPDTLACKAMPSFDGCGTSLSVSLSLSLSFREWYRLHVLNRVFFLVVTRNVWIHKFLFVIVFFFDFLSGSNSLAVGTTIVVTHFVRSDDMLLSTGLFDQFQKCTISVLLVSLLYVQFNEVVGCIPLSSMFIASEKSSVFLHSFG